MIYRFVIISDECEDFRRDIRIDSSATFFQLNETILDTVNYTHSEATRFLITDKAWRPKNEVLLIDMGFSSSDKEIYLMEKTTLDDLLEEEGDRMLFNFDMLGDRYFFMELREVILGQNLKTPEITRSKGEAPKQLSDVDELLALDVTKQAVGAKQESTNSDVDEYSSVDDDSNSFDLDEIDAEGFEFTEEETIGEE